MEKYYPSYYEKFTCIADECPFTCCQEWKIAVDKKTLNSWKSLSAPEGTYYDGKCLAESVSINMGSEAITLNESRLCPFLTDNKLCSIVLKYGEECISKTCRTFPKVERNYGLRTEYNLDLGCPWALELLLKEKDFIIEKKVELTDEVDKERLFFDIRDLFIHIVSDEKYDLNNALKMCFYILNRIYEADDEKYSDEEAYEEYLKVFNEVKENEFLDELYLALKDSQKNGNIYNSCEKYSEYNELFLDIADNYNKKGMYDKIIGDIYRRAIELEDTDISDLYLDFLSSEYYHESNIRLIIKEELFSTLYMPEGDIYYMLLKLQWIILFYVVSIHCLLLKWNIGELNTDIEKTVVSVVLRMTGYGEDDIEEYLENSFEEPIWSWDYIVLLL